MTAKRNTSTTPVHGWTPFTLKEIRPGGWIRSFLDRQRTGLTGHLQVAGYPFNTKGWLDDHLKMDKNSLAGWWPYEQYAYWVDGMMRCGVLLDDEGLKKKARRQIDHVLANPDSDGYLGPQAMKQMKHPHDSPRWPHAVFFRAVIADWQDRPSKSTLKKLIAHYLSNTSPHDINRNTCNIEIMAWLYEQTGDRRILEMAERDYAAYQVNEAQDGATLKNMASRKRIGDHGPRHMELFKLAAVMYRVTGKRTYLAAAENANRKLIRDHMLIDGVPSTTEHLRGTYSTAGHETCVITDYLWALGYLLQCTGDAAYADAMERICFNALPGAVTHDFKALQYFSGPNQVIAGPNTNHHPHGTASKHISFRPMPGTECCPGNVHRAMPAYVGRMWMRGNGDLSSVATSGARAKEDVVACLYGPGELRTKVAGKAVTITQETAYPFSDHIAFRFACRGSVKMTFRFRIPSWCTSPELRVNGRKSSRKLRPGTFAAINRTFRNGDVIDLTLPRELRIEDGPENGVGLVYGPLVMALKIDEARRVEKDGRSNKRFPAWTIEPASAWNYGLVPDCVAELEEDAAGDNPWKIGAEPIRLYLPARRIPGWRLIRKKRHVKRHGKHKWVEEGDIAFMTKLPDAKACRAATKREDLIELVPYGCTNLRIAWFPVVE